MHAKMLQRSVIPLKHYHLSSLGREQLPGFPNSPFLSFNPNAPVVRFFAQITRPLAQFRLP
jgi:hypothetical protein